MTDLNPWVLGPFELLAHAEEHFRRGDDFDRRMALVLFDDAFEVSIATYLSLHPIHRGNREYAKSDVDRWLTGFHPNSNFSTPSCRRETLRGTSTKGTLCGPTGNAMNSIMVAARAPQNGKR